MATMVEISRMIKGLRRLGWTDTQIDDFLLYIEEGDESVFKRIEEKLKSKNSENDS